MAVFMVERNIKGISMDDLAGAQKAAIATAESLCGSASGSGTSGQPSPPGTDAACALFEGGTEDPIRALNDKAGLPYHRVVPALDLTP